MVPLAARQTRALELDMRRSVHGGNSTLVSGLDQRVKAGGKPDTMSLSAARSYSLISGRTTYHGIPV
jgi:hypothetical protein